MFAISLKTVPCFSWLYNWITALVSICHPIPVRKFNKDKFCSFADMDLLSSPVLEALMQGNLQEIHRLTGVFYTLRGQVVPGKQIGRTIGFPTANLNFPDNPMLPAQGVYAVTVEFNGRKRGGVANIGLRPTLNLETLSVEVHLFDFEENIYGQTLSVSFIARIRAERKFQNINELKTQITMDVEVAKSLLSQWNQPDPNP